MPRCNQCNEITPTQYIRLEKELGILLCYGCYSNMPKFKSKGYLKKQRMRRGLTIN
jgi:hypothetical protein